MQLGQAYNRAMETVSDWVLFLDHDVLILNPHYYEMLMHAVKTVGHKAGWVSGVTNRIANGWQNRRPAEDPDDLAHHMDHAKKLYQRHGNELIDSTGKQQAYCGFFILTHKQAWKDAGGFLDGFWVDRQYCEALWTAGYQTYIMPGLYCFHYRTRHKWTGEPIK